VVTSVKIATGKAVLKNLFETAVDFVVITVCKHLNVEENAGAPVNGTMPRPWRKTHPSTLHLQPSPEYDTITLAAFPYAAEPFGKTKEVTRQSKCDSPLRGQSHLLCLVTIVPLLHEKMSMLLNCGIIFRIKEQNHDRYQEDP